jgi:hypothetical protein
MAETAFACCGLNKYEAPKEKPPAAAKIPAGESESCSQKKSVEPPASPDELQSRLDQIRKQEQDTGNSTTEMKKEKRTLKEQIKEARR